MTAQRDLIEAHEAYKADDLEKADQLCVAILESQPRFAKAHQLRALIARKANNMPAALDHILKALAITPHDAECLNTYGNVLRSMGRLTEAIEAYRKALAVAPNYIQAAQSLGELYLYQKDPIQAVAVFETALSYHEGHPHLMRGLLFALKDSQQNDAAFELLANIPQAPDLALTAGQLLAQQGQTVQAQAAFRQALSHPQTAALAFRNIVQGVWMKEGFEGAKAHIENMIKTAPEAGFVYLTAANLYSDMGQDKDARDVLVQCEAKFGIQPDIDAAMADWHIRNGEAELALERAGRALSQRQGDPNIAAHYARACLMNGLHDQALRLSGQVQAVMPDNQFWIAIEATARRGLDMDHHVLYNYDKFVRPYDLEPPAEYDDVIDFIAQLKSALEKRHAHQHHPMGQSLRHGTQTSADLRFAPDRVIQDFFGALRAPISAYMDHIGQAMDHPLTRRNTRKYRMTGAWSVRLQGEGYHVNHVHPEGWISSAFYVDVPKGTFENPDKKGWIKFGEPPFSVPDGQGGVMGPEHSIAPQAGRLVLFPSYMWHGTIPIKSDATRMTLPFDVVPA